MDCFTLLKRDHDEVAKLLQQCQSEGEKNSAKETFKKAAREIAVHSKLEETLIYPRLKEFDELSEQIDEAYEEHGDVEDLLEEMAELSPGDEEWTSNLVELIDTVEHHVQEEENEVFPVAMKLIGEDQAEDLGNAIAQEKKEMMSGSHGAAKEVFARLGL